MTWTDQQVFFIDFEGSVSSGVLEYGVVTLLGGKVSAAATRLCAPTGRIRPEDTEIHRLHEETLARLEPFSADWELFARYRENGPLAAHHAGAENSLIRATWPYPRNSPDFARPGSRAIDWGPWIDTARIYAQLYAKLDSTRLAARYCPVGRRFYHAALYDALAGALLLASLARQPQLASLSVTQLLALSTLDPGKRDSILQRELF